MYEITDRHHWDFATDCCYWPPYCKFGFDLLGIYQKPKKGCPVIGRDPAMSGSIYTLFLPYMYGYKTYQIPIYLPCLFYHRVYGYLYQSRQRQS